MKTFKISTLVIALFFLCLSCKKKEVGATPAPVLSSTTVVTDPANTYRGFMISRTSTITVDSVTFSSQGVEARFLQKPVKAFGGGNEVDLKYISVNGFPLTNKDMFIYAFKEQHANIDLNTDTWVVNDTNGIMTFTYTNKTPFPSVKDTKVIPDSASKTVGFSFKLENVANLNSGSFVISNGGTVSVIVSLSAGDNQINISSDNLQAIGTSTAAYVELYLANSKVQSFFGKNYQFSKQMSFRKPFKVNP